jgi:hypothetical protein
MFHSIIQSVSTPAEEALVSRPTLSPGPEFASQKYYRYYYYYYYLIKLQMGFTRWQWYYRKTQHTKIHISAKITHHTQTKHSTQSYTTIKDTLHTMKTRQKK